MKSHYRWFIVALLFLISMTNYIDRASISYAISEIVTEFHFDDAQVGYILGAFGFGYLMTILMGGILADKYGSHRVLTFACSLWMMATLCMGFAQGFFFMFFARTFLGIAEGPNFPCVTKTIKEWLPLEERNRALSMSLIASPIALAFTGPFVTKLIVHYHWRNMYFILAGISLVFIVLWWFLYRDEPEKSSLVSPQELALIKNSPQIKQIQSKNMTIAEIFKNQTLMANSWGYFVFGFYLFFFMNWMPEYLNHSLHLNLTKIGYFTIIPWLTAAFMMIIMGWLTDYIYKKTKNLRYSRTYPLIISHLISGLALIPLLLSRQIIDVLISMSLSLGAVMSVNSVYYAVNIDKAPHKAATAFGLMGLFFSLSGIVSPIITGWIVNITSSFYSVFLIMLILSLSSCFILWFFHNRQIDERILKK